MLRHLLNLPKVRSPKIELVHLETHLENSIKATDSLPERLFLSTSFQIPNDARYRSILSSLKGQWIPNFASLQLDRMYECSKDKGLTLIIGQNNPYLCQLLSKKQTISLEELSMLFPTKVPLSLRPPPSQTSIEQIQARLQTKLSAQPSIGQVLVINEAIDMWDEAIQCILDSHEAPILIPFHSQETYVPYRVSIGDFVRNTKAIYERLYPTQNPLNFIMGTVQAQIQWAIANRVDHCEEVVIDSNLLPNIPHEGLCRQLHSVFNNIAFKVDSVY